MATPHRLSARALTQLLPKVAELPAPRYRSIADAIAALLLDARIAPGSGLPSERDLAAALEVSRSTTTAVYQRLAESGLLTSRRGSGSFLRLPAGSRISGPGSRLQREYSATPVIDLSIASLPAAAGLLESAAARAIPRLTVLAAGVGYQPYGITELRTLIAERYTERGVPTGPDEILVTNGAQHGLDLILRLSLSVGDRVLTELPTYPGALDAIRAAGGRVLAMPFAADGSWDVGTLTSTLLQTSPRLAVLMPDFNNPTGALIPTDQRRAVLAAARQAGTRVVIDESFVDLDLSEAAGNRPAAMAALDGRVLSVGSLSKPVWGGLRIGWVRTDTDTVARLALLRARSDMSGSVFDQLMACELLADYQPIVQQRRTELRERRAALLSALAEQLPHWRPSQPAGGMSTWVRLDAPASTALTHLLEQRAILLTPGSRFTVDAGLERYLRIPYALPSGVLVAAVQRIAQAWQELDQRRVRRPETEVLVPT